MIALAEPLEKLLDDRFAWRRAVIFGSAPAKRPYSIRMLIRDSDRSPAALLGFRSNWVEHLFAAWTHIRHTLSARYASAGSR